MTKSIVAGLIGLGAMLGAGAAQAADCNAGKPGGEMSPEEAQKVYDCIQAELHAGYKAGNTRWIPRQIVTDFDSWTSANKHPATTDFHNGQFLVTYVNEIGKDEYLKFDESDAPIPAGSVLAKASFWVDLKGNPRKGPLFLMEKRAAGESPRTDDWHYYMVSAGGAAVAINVMKDCVECHNGAFGGQRGLGYPEAEVRAE